MLTVGINGFGRIGRMCLRVCLEQDIQVNLINDPFISTDYMLYLFKYDSTHGTYPTSMECEKSTIIIGNNRIATSQEKDPLQIKWKNFNVNFVIESTGVFTTLHKASMHIDAGARRVVITAPSIDSPMIVYGVNHYCYDPKHSSIISTASCTTNCAAPIIKVMDENFEVLEVMITSIHATTATQKTVDGPTGQLWRDGRGCLQNIIPTSTGAAKCLSKVIPSLRDKVSAIAFKVPVANVSLCDMTFRINKPASYEEIKTAMKLASANELQGILHYTEDDVVSSDFNHTKYSCIFDVKAGIPQTGTFIKIVAWYDNEYGYANRIIDLIKFMYDVDMGKSCPPLEDLI
ncbi:glyceraldehyde-3-phosphate dehydrogenase-like [Chelonus insularis]|uniref:glyceraldehyde-3-phosphate dehydrogenase-like n=1 Tax=Chelonus insularis TaxID=460826 RepID=UPI00158AB6FB|nr:glyceraldehyde-3-phosphate dehydrogenase-like [Chelonus insularis]